MGVGAGGAALAPNAGLVPKGADVLSAGAGACAGVGVVGVWVGGVVPAAA